MKTISARLLTILLIVSCSDKVIIDKAGVHSNGSSNASANIKDKADYREWHFSTEDESFFENKFEISLADQYRYEIVLNPIFAVQAKLKQFENLESYKCELSTTEYCFDITQLVDNIELAQFPDYTFKLEDLSRSSITALDQDGKKLPTELINDASTVKYTLDNESTIPTKIVFQGNIRIFNKRAYTLPEITNKGEVEVWESDDNGNKIADIVAYEINTNNESTTSTIEFAESEYWDYRKIIVEYEKRRATSIGFKLSFEPEKDSVKIKWNGETCPEFKNQKLRIDPLSPSIVWALCPSLPALTK